MFITERQEKEKRRKKIFFLKLILSFSHSRQQVKVKGRCDEDGTRWDEEKFHLFLLLCVWRRWAAQGKKQQIAISSVKKIALISRNRSICSIILPISSQLVRTFSRVLERIFIFFALLTRSRWECEMIYDFDTRESKILAQITEKNSMKFNFRKSLAQNQNRKQTSSRRYECYQSI